MAVEFRCADVGADCKNVARAESEEQLLQEVRQHAREAHGVELTDTLVEYARKNARQS